MMGGEWPRNEFTSAYPATNYQRGKAGHAWSGAKAEGGGIAFCALSDATAIAMARGLRILLQAP